MNQKIENLLNISMNISEEERSKNEDLSAGFNESDQTWEFVIKYSGSEETIRAFWPRPVVFLYNHFFIFVIIFLLFAAFRSLASPIWSFRFFIPARYVKFCHKKITDLKFFVTVLLLHFFGNFVYNYNVIILEGMIP